MISRLPCHGEAGSCLGSQANVFCYVDGTGTRRLGSHNVMNPGSAVQTQYQLGFIGFLPAGSYTLEIRFQRGAPTGTIRDRTLRAFSL